MMEICFPITHNGYFIVTSLQGQILLWLQNGPTFSFPSPPHLLPKIKANQGIRKDNLTQNKTMKIRKVSTLTSTTKSLERIH